VGRKRIIAALGEPKLSWTCTSCAPVARATVRSASPEMGVGMRASMATPPLKSMPRFRPWVKNDTHEPAISRAEIAAATGAHFTKRKWVWRGIRRMRGQAMMGT
jgi:hypothetical protein